MPCDYKKYPKNWFSEIRPAVLKRANNCCEFCKAPNHTIIYRGIINDEYCWQDESGIIYNMKGDKIGEDYIGFSFSKDKFRTTKIILTIAHLDHDKENHDVKLDRLRALCQKCHLGYDMPRHISNRKETLKKKKGIIEIPFN